MTRERLLVGLLIVLAVFALPYYYLNRVLVTKAGQVQTLSAQAGPIRAKALKLKTRQTDLDQAKATIKAAAQRFVKADPTLEIRSELDRIAVKSGVVLTAFSLKSGEKIPDLPDLPGTVKYNASIQVSGSRTQFVAFLRGLEQSAYLIEIPTLNVTLQPKPPEVTMPLTLVFFGKSA